MGSALKYTLNFTASLARSLKALVADFLIYGHWYLPYLLRIARPTVAAQISAVRPYFGGDTLIWTSNSDGVLSLRDSYDICRD